MSGSRNNCESPLAAVALTRADGQVDNFSKLFEINDSANDDKYVNTVFQKQMHHKSFNPDLSKYFSE